MRSTVRTALATATAVGLLAIPVAAGAADTGETVTNLTLNGATGTLSITVPAGDLTTANDLGDLTISTGQQTTANSLGEVVVADTATGVLKVTTVTVDTGITASPTVGFCQDTDGLTGGIACTGALDEQILKTAVGYNFNGIVEAGLGATDSVETNTTLGAATAVHTAVGAGAFTMTWTPVLDVTLLGTEIAGEYYGIIEHSVSSVGV